jgi:SAM-dependent methyltransferase
VTGAIHRTAARGFGDLATADAYDRGRPGYPAPALDLVAELTRASPPGPVIDLAAGTGILTAGLVERGLVPIALEPVAPMRARLATRVPGVSVVAAVAEALPVADDAVAAVAVAQAFHWFDGAAATAEIARVTSAGAALIVVFNVRDPGDPMQAELEAIWEPYRQDTPTHRSGDWRTSVDEHPAFLPLEHAAFRHEQVVDADALVDRVVSVSFIATLPEAERAAVADRTRRLAGAAKSVSLPYRTDVWWTRRRRGHRNQRREGRRENRPQGRSAMRA